MTAKNLNFLLLSFILITVLALLSHRFFPQRTYNIIPNLDSMAYVYGSNLADGSPIAGWIDKAKRSWYCTYPEPSLNLSPYCGFGVVFNGSSTEGIDLSGFNKINIFIQYHGSASKIRLNVRNFDPAYSTVEDNNSTKFNALTIQTKHLTKELSIDINELVVSDWWQSQYNIERANAHTDLSHALSIGIDFADTTALGRHELAIEKIEFTGEYISSETLYLVILMSWLTGVLFFSVSRLYLMHQQARHDTHIINNLNQHNERLKKESDKFRRLSTVDPLTQTYNRFGIDQIVTTLLNHAAKSKYAPQTPYFALMVLDIDHFKRVNDRRGHDAGDRVLQTVASTIQNSIRNNDFLGRWGGEEFVVILPNTKKEFAIALAEKIRLRIYDTEFEPEQPLNITISVGVGEHQTDEDFANTFKRVDLALYEAKHIGRNCCVMATTETNENA